MKKLFGTDGIRGRANRYPMTPEVALSLGQAIALHFAKKKGGGRILIGKDTRRSSYMFEYALSAGISSMGAETILTGPLPTPGIAFLTCAMRADAGVVISASHNLFEDNGIKFFDSEGFKLSDDVELQMEEYVFSSHDDSIKPTGSTIGRAIRIKDAVGRYVEFLKSTFPKGRNLKGVKIVVDCANGAGYLVGPLVFLEMDAEVIPAAVSPNGTNINDRCGALHPETMIKLVRDHKADIGIAIDGDGDRAILCDEKGEIVDGDRVLALCALERKKEGKLAGDTVVGTVLSNMGLERYLKKNGLKLVRTQVGDRSIMTEMRKHGYTLGGEPSGHLIFMDLATTGDGLIAALQVLAYMQKMGKPLSTLAHQMPLYPQQTKNIKIREKKALEKIAPLQKEVKAVEKELEGKGRVILRYSGTEPVLRVTVEGEDDRLVSRNLQRLSECIEANL
ncbi:MAG: phosphoglucosamine mutase [Deltaproteobacteria bacterium]|nr:phosphoglucosamine mutase [Deltaproteobacteria bacterium]